MVRKFMTNSIQEIFVKNNKWLDKKYATYGNIQNTFTGGIFKILVTKPQRARPIVKSTSAAPIFLRFFY